MQKFEADRDIATDSLCQEYIGENRWYISQATMYALLALLEK